MSEYQARGSSVVEREAHNLDVAGSIPAPATTLLRPVGSRVLVRPVYPESEGTIVLANPDDPTTADVLAVGEPRCRTCGDRQTLGVVPGQRVTLRPEALFHEVTVSGETLWLVPIDDVVAEVLPEG